MPRTIGFLVGCVAIVLMPGRGSEPAAKAADPIREWSVAASEAAAATEMPPFRAPITLAILHLAMYDAVMAITKDREPYLAKVPVTDPASPHAAAVEAGYRVLRTEFPTAHESIARRYEQLLAAVADSPAKKNGMAIGAIVASRLLDARARDGRNATRDHTPGTGAGGWIPTPPTFRPVSTAFLASVVPFTMSSGSQFRPAGPPPLDSPKWAEEYNEVKRLGGKGSARTDAQTATAMFWQPLAGTVWPATIRRLAAERALGLPSSAHFHAAAFTAFADGLIACWEAKFHFNFWRPVTAIQRGESDGNDRTERDPDWEPLVVTPDFPEYPSGHACATAAVAYTIEAFFPNSPIPARLITSDEERVYRRAEDVVNEVVEARMLLGVHFRSADVDGAEMGRRIAEQIRHRFALTPP